MTNKQSKRIILKTKKWDVHKKSLWKRKMNKKIKRKISLAQLKINRLYLML